VVVAVGLMVVDPLAAVDVNVPGVMAIVVAPVDVQLRVLLVPEFMLVGFAIKELMAGREAFPVGAVEPQPISATPAKRTMAITASARRCVPGSLSSEEGSLSVLDEVIESMNALVAVGRLFQ
jgi:hypothetical protein